LKYSKASLKRPLSLAHQKISFDSKTNKESIIIKLAVC